MSKSRLFQMLYLLIEKGSTTAPFLADYFEVSVRTIYRDIDILSSVGVPIYAQQGKGGGIFIKENFVLNKLLVSEEEQKQILMALQGLNIVDDKGTEDILLKLGGIFQKQNTNWIEIDLSGWVKGDVDDSIFSNIKSAIFQNKKICFNYYNSFGEKSERLVEPLKLVFKNKDWFLYAYCNLRKDFRFFKLTRIKNLKLTLEEYKRVIPEKSIKYKKIDENVISIRLKFDKSLLFRIYDEFPGIEIDEIADNIILDVDLPYGERLFNYIISFGDKVEVISPKEIKEELIIRIDRIKNVYKT